MPRDNLAAGRARLLALLLGLVLVMAFPLSAWASAQAVAQGDYVAYSLREAEKLAQRGKGQTPGFLDLGGMTQILGMVHDKAGQDIILVGRKSADYPAVDFDDLVVAFRARLVKGVWPLVSIDSTPETAKTRQQTVRFEGNLADTHFGKQFLECDIILKKYSLGLVDTVPTVATYKDLCERDIRARFAAKGRQITQGTWQQPQEFGKAAQTYQNRKVENEETLYCRFWFYPRENATMVEDQGVLAIPELKIAVMKEVKAGKAKGKESQNKAADDFASQFSQHLGGLQNKHQVLKTLHGLYSLVAVAEGISHLEARPGLDYLLNQHPVPRVETAKSFDLLELIGVFQQSHGVTYLTRLSGGIELEAIIESLNAGDVRALRDAVTKSRPTPEALYWRLPLTSWELTVEDRKKAQGQTQARPQGSGKLGCYITNQSYTLTPSATLAVGNEKKFTGFPPPDSFLPPAMVTPSFKQVPTLKEAWQRGGVWVDPKPTKTGTVSKEYREKLLNGRPKGDPGYYDVVIPKDLEKKQ